MTPADAKEAVLRYWREKANAALSSARAELAAGRYDFAVNRAYYAAYYAASAALTARDKRFVKHTGLRAAIHRDLVHAGELPVEWGRAFDRLFESRQTADYEEMARFDVARASELIGQAEGFVQEMNRLLDRQSGGGQDGKNKP